MCQKCVKNFIKFVRKLKILLKNYNLCVLRTFFCAMLVCVKSNFVRYFWIVRANPWCRGSVRGPQGAPRARVCPKAVVASAGPNGTNSAINHSLTQSTTPREPNFVDKSVSGFRLV